MSKNIKSGQQNSKTGLFEFGIHLMTEFATSKQNMFFCM